MKKFYLKFAANWLTIRYYDIINADRYNDIDAINSILYTMSEHVVVQEIEEMKRLTNAKYDIWITQYDCC